MQSTVQKQFLLLDGKPLLWYSLKAFEDSPAGDIILVTGEEDAEYCRKEIVEHYGFQKVRAIVPGGKERYHSVYEGLKALKERLGYGEKDYVMIHDGARPFVDAGMIERVMKAAERYGACVAGMPSKDTVKLSDNDGFAVQTPERSRVWTIQTPQTFKFGLIYGAYQKLLSDTEYQKGITDDAMVVETMCGGKVKLVEGSYENIKVTTPEDMIVAESILENRKKFAADDSTDKSL